MDFFYNSICHVCKIIETNLKRCASCRFVAYCSKRHQECDWKNHKPICKLLSKYMQLRKSESNFEYNTWRFYRLQLKFNLEQKLGRQLLTHESQMWMFPRNCGVCYSSECLEDCQECFCVAYCSSKHRLLDRERHSTFCSKLKLCLELERFQVDYPEIEIKFKEVNQNIQCLPNNIHETIELFVDISQLNNFLEKVIVTDIFASMLTIVYSIEKCKFLIERNLLSESLVIHLVGADISELSLNWEYMIHFLELWIENLNNCEIILIGPDHRLNSQKLFSNKKIKVQYFNDFYHNIVKIIQKPNIIIAFNSGLHEYQFDEANDTWKKSLPKLVNNSAPLVLTAYTRSEIEKDLNRFNSFNVLQILSTQINPFSNLRPIRDWDSPDNEPFHVNGYITIIADSEYSNVISNDACK